jgi:hypothetical protein
MVGWDSLWTVLERTIHEAVELRLKKRLQEVEDARKLRKSKGSSRESPCGLQSARS